MQAMTGAAENTRYGHKRLILITVHAALLPTSFSAGITILAEILLPTPFYTTFGEDTVW